MRVSRERSSRRGRVRAGHVLAWLIVAAQLAGCGARAAPALSTTPTSAPQRDSPPTVSHPQPLSVRPPSARPPSVGSPSVGSPGATRPSARVSPAIVEHGPRSRRWVALTFDADMTRAMLSELRTGRVHGWYDAALFAELRETRTPATIFLTGLWTERYPAVVRRLARDPRFELENHSLDTLAGSPVLRPADGLGRAVEASRDRSRQPDHRARRARHAALLPLSGRLRERRGQASGGRLRRTAGGLGRRVRRRVPVRSGSHRACGPVGRAAGSIVVAHCIGAPNTPATARAMALVIPAL